MVCTGGAAAPVNCTNGTTAHPAQTFCGVIATSCPAGEFLESVSSFCVQCPVGSWCAGGNSAVQPQSCPAGQSTFGAGATSFAACEISCTPGDGLDGGACITCDWNTYSPGGARSACTACPPGTRNTTRIGANSTLSCSVCAPGTAWNGTACGDCPSGKACLGGQSAAVSCPTGSTVNTTSKAACVGNCGSGNYFYSTGPTTGFCTPCSYPNVCQGGSSMPINCAAQTPARVPNSASGGTYCVTPQTTCNAGRYLQSGLCNICLTGYACAGGTAGPTLCQSPQLPNPNRDACVNPATSCDPGSYLSSGVCVTCSPFNGQACLGGTAGPTSCVSPTIVNWNATACVARSSSCNPGWYVNMFTCFPCSSQGSNWYCPGGNASAQFCSLPNVVSTDMSSCVPPLTCAAGTYASGGVCVSCTTGALDVCPGGSGPNARVFQCTSPFTPNAQRTACSVSSSTTCVAGQRYNGQACVSCASDSSLLPTQYCPGGNFAAASTCPSGQVGNANKDACTASGSSNICNVGNYYNGNACVSCTVGCTCAGGSAQPNCQSTPSIVTCPAGQFVNNGVCTACTAGCTCYGYTTPPLCPISCPAGRFCAYGHGRDDRRPIIIAPS
jgi:hypothetical protein